MSVLLQHLLPLDLSLLQQPLLSLGVSVYTVAACEACKRVCLTAVFPVSGRVWPTAACAAFSYIYVYIQHPMLPLVISVLLHSELCLAAGLVCVYFLQPLLSMGMSGLQQLVLHLDIYVKQVSELCQESLVHSSLCCTSIVKRPILKSSLMRQIAPLEYINSLLKRSVPKKPR
jgi:hypothetical protein